MKVLVIGSGGREHALAWKLAQCRQAEKIFCAPGNGGTDNVAENVPIHATDIPTLLDFAEKGGIGLTVVGPEVPLVAGIADAFQARGLRVFGPTAEAARLEGSKVFAKEVMARAGVPTAEYHVFSEAREALGWLARQPVNKPWVVKADGLAAGKGVLVCADREQTAAAVTQVLIHREFGHAGDRVLIEERLNGSEVSLLAICSGTDFVTLAPAQDYKRALDGDMGLNTGGMGCYSPVPTFSPELMAFGVDHVIRPVLEQVPFVGVLYAGLMVTADGPKVLEFNVRFGDPETQVVLPRLETSLLQLLLAATEGKLGDVKVSWSPNKAVTVVLTAHGYPSDHRSGDEIHGLPQAAERPDVMIFHAGTRRDGQSVLTSGGRVINVTALGDTFAEAIDRAYAAARCISWQGMTFRHDIAARVREQE